MQIGTIHPQPHTVFCRLVGSPITYLLFCSILVCSAGAQWRIPTPRDTVYVPANQKSFVVGKFALTTGVEMWVSPSGTFNEIDGATTFSLDAAFTYGVNGASLIPQSENPPTYAGKSHKYALTVSTIPGLNETNFKSLENAFQLE